jgi:anti-sigma regulatory factor (Ser/Thr protein kinase)
VQANSGPTQPAEFRLVLSPDTEAGWRTRQALRQRFGESLPARSLIDLTAIVTELVNNSVARGPRRPITVALAVEDGSIRGEIADQGNPATVVPQGKAEARKGHLGLRVVDELASRWGVYEGSTHIWFVLPIE